MTDTEIEKLALSKDYCSPHGNANVETSAFIAGYKARDAVEQWISVKDRLPDYDEYVLWHSEDGNCHVEALDKDGNPWLYGGEEDGFKYPKVTHWQPLPSQPKK